MSLILGLINFVEKVPNYFKNILEPELRQCQEQNQK